MAFDTPASNPSSRTYLDAVQQVISGIGITKPSDFTTPTKHTLVAMNSVNQAIGAIWYKAQWTWRYRFVFLTMVDKTFMYALPNDFVESGASVMRPKDNVIFDFASYKLLVETFPGLAWPDEVTMAAEGGTYLAEMTTIIDNDATLGGMPTHWTIIGRQLGLFPIPWLSNVDADDFADKDRIMVGYYGALKQLTAVGDALPIPVDFYNIVHWLASAYVKQAFEYPDASADEGRGERLLEIAVAREKRVGKSELNVGVRKQW